MVDPLSQIVSLLQPSASLSKLVVGAGPWRVRRSEAGRPFYCVILEGICRLSVSGQEPITLKEGDFVLIPSVQDFAASSLEPPPDDVTTMPVEVRPAVFQLGRRDEPADIRMLIGYCTFGSDDATLLVSLLPRLVHVREQPRLTTLVQLVDEESREYRPARAIVLAHLIEVLLIEALRSTTGGPASRGLLRGLADERLAIALRHIHDRPTWPWTVAELAKEAALSRSSFFEQFKRAIGLSPMEYLFHWRMALAKDLLRRKEGGVAQVAERVGYSSASTFSVAFTRHVGLPPSAYRASA